MPINPDLPPTADPPAATPTAETAPKRKPSELQTPFLNAHRGKRVAVYLVNGIRLNGVLRSFDQFTLLLDNHGTEQLVYKQVISTVSPEISKPEVRTTAAHRRVPAETESTDA